MSHAFLSKHVFSPLFKSFFKNEETKSLEKAQAGLRQCRENGGSLLKYREYTETKRKGHKQQKGLNVKQSIPRRSTTKRVKPRTKY